MYSSPKQSALMSGRTSNFRDKSSPSRSQRVPPTSAGIAKTNDKFLRKDMFPDDYIQKFHPQILENDRQIKANKVLKSRNKSSTDESLSDSDESDTDVKLPKRRLKGITANLSATRYDVVADAAYNTGFKIIDEEETESFMFWSDVPFPLERISELKPYQWVNHFPAMNEICRKDFLARNIAKMARMYPAEFNFVPKTWIMPTEHIIWHNYAHELRMKKVNKTYIKKPVNGAMGAGIHLIRNLEKVVTSESCIIQEYIDKPFLMDGYKCDMRIYVLITSIDPLRIHLYNNGLLRMGTERYAPPSDSNTDRLYMHLTNYAINRHSENYQEDDDADKGSKRSLEYFKNYLRNNGYDVNLIWQDIKDLIVKTLIVALPQVFHAYKMCRAGDGPGAASVCFEILGFDILLDRKLKPWLIEVNRSPSFETKRALDYDVKLNLLEEAFNMLNIRAKDKKINKVVEREETNKRLMAPLKRDDYRKTNLATEKRKRELIALLKRVSRDERRDSHECHHARHYVRIFPSLDQSTNQRYNEFITNAFTVFQHEVKRKKWTTGESKDLYSIYNTDLKSYEIIDLITECDSKLLEAPSISVVEHTPVRPSRPSTIRRETKTVTVHQQRVKPMALVPLITTIHRQY